MSRLVATIDLSSANVGSQGSFETQTPNNCSALYVMNESAAFLQLDLGINGQPIVQPWRNRLFPLKQSIQNAQWTVIAVLQSGGAPSNAVYVEAFAPNEIPSATLDGPVFRQSNVGNNVPVGTSSSTIANDGNATGTVVIEATPSGAASSQLKATNDGAFLCGGGLFSISNAGIVTAIPAGAIPASGVGSGYPAASLAAGTLPSGVSVPAASVTGTVAAATTASNLGGGITSYDNATYLVTGINTQEPAGAGRGILFQSWDGTTTHSAFSIGTSGSHGATWVDDNGNITGPVGGGIPTTRNGSALSVPIFTGTNTPSSPPTGALWAAG